DVLAPADLVAALAAPSAAPALLIGRLSREGGGGQGGRDPALVGALVPLGPATRAVGGGPEPTGGPPPLPLAVPRRGGPGGPGGAGGGRGGGGGGGGARGGRGGRGCGGGGGGGGPTPGGGGGPPRGGAGAGPGPGPGGPAGGGSPPPIWPACIIRRISSGV